jgi:hypothetical protein
MTERLPDEVRELRRKLRSSQVRLGRAEKQLAALRRRAQHEDGIGLDSDTLTRVLSACAPESPIDTVEHATKVATVVAAAQRKG